MSGGEKAAEDTKTFFKDLGGATDGIRQNINSFADNLLSGNKQGTSVGRAGDDHPVAGHKTDHVQDNSGSGILGSGTHHTSATGTSGVTGHTAPAGAAGNTGTTGGSADAGVTGSTAAHPSTGIHPDAQATAGALGRGVESAGAKLDSALHGNRA